MMAEETFELVKPASDDWAYPDLEADFKARQYVWREVSESFYWQALEVMPPVYVPGGFLVGEPWSHNANGQAISAAFTKIGDRYFATMTTVERFNHRREQLLIALR